MPAFGPNGVAAAAVSGTTVIEQRSVRIPRPVEVKPNPELRRRPELGHSPGSAEFRARAGSHSQIS